MKFQDIPADILTLRVKPTGDVGALREQPVLSVEADPSRPDEFDIRLKDALVSVRPVADNDVLRLNAELASGRTLLAQLANPAADGSTDLRIAFFTGECVEMGNVDIGVDEYVEDAVAELWHRKNEFKGERLYEMLDRRCCLRHGDSAYFFLTAGPAIDHALQPEGAETEADDGSDAAGSKELEKADEPNPAPGKAAPAQKAVPNRKNSFCVTGDGIRFVATASSQPNNKSIFVTTRLTKPRKGYDRAMRLARGSLRFVDWTQAGQIQILARAQMTELTQDNGSYLKKWDEFGDLEGELLLRQAREVGALKFSDMLQQRNGTVSVHISGAADCALDALADGRVPEVQIVDELPDYLSNESLRFVDFANGMKQAEESERQRLISASPISTGNR
jgi:hypothetical protein